MSTKKIWPFPGLDRASVSAEWATGLDGSGFIRICVVTSPISGDSVTVTIAEHDGVRLTMPPVESVDNEISWKKSGPETLAILCTCTPVVKMLCEQTGWSSSPVTQKLDEWTAIVSDIEEFFSVAFVQES
jgi:hypothetical protein